MLIVDPDPAWAHVDRPGDRQRDRRPQRSRTSSAPAARNAALYFPCVREVDPLRDSRVDTFVPSGIIAGIMARTDVSRGVWKAPAGLDAALNGVQDLQVNLNDLENGQLNPLGINCLRSFGVNGRIVWGARTLRGADESADEYKYLPVRRLALFLEESLYRGTQWVVFEPNDEPLWAQIRLNVGAFMQGLFRQGAFQGATPRDAYFVKCDSQTTTQNDINLGIVNIIVGFAPLKPAEFVVIQIQQMAGQIANLSRGRRHGTVQRQRDSASTRTRTSSSASSGTAATSPACRKVGALKRTTEVVEHREGGDPSSIAQVAGAHEVRRDHARSRRHPRHRVREVGQQGLELRLRAWAPRCR